MMNSDRWQIISSVASCECKVTDKPQNECDVSSDAGTVILSIVIDI